MRAHFTSYGPLAAWISLAGLGRILAVYHPTPGSDDGSLSASHAKKEMDRFVIEAGGGRSHLVDERSGSHGVQDGSEADLSSDQELDELIRNLPR